MTTIKKYFAAGIAAVLLAASAPAFALPTLSVNALPNPATAGSTVDLAFMISDIADLYGYQFTVNFDPALLKAKDVTEGGFLGTAGTTFSDGGSIDNAGGTISFIFNTLIGAVAGASGAGELVHIRFDTLGAGSAGISFSDLLFLDAGAADIAVSAADTSIDINPASAVPEPASYLLLAAGLIAVGAARRQRPAAR